MRIFANTYQCLKGHNDDSLGIAFMGSFEDSPPSNDMLKTVLQLFDNSEVFKKVSEDYRINGQKDLRATRSPGEACMQIIRHWPRYSPN